MSTGSRESVASALAPLSVLAVLVAGASAGVTYAGQPAREAAPDPDPSGSPSNSAEPTVDVPDGQQLVRGDPIDAAQFLVPDADGWTVEPAGTDVGYQTSDGAATQTVSGPAFFAEGWCDSPDASSSRAFVGFTGAEEAEGATAQTVAEDRLDAWLEVVGTRDDGRRAPVSTPTLSPVRLDDGAAAWTAGAVVTPDEGECVAPGIEVRVVSTGVGDSVTNLVMVRDVRADGSDLDGGLPNGVADTILRSLDPL